MNKNNIILSCNIDTSLSTHYLIYKIVNNSNNKYYIGQHKTNNIYDNYMGSGTVINEAISKYGLSNFTKIILFDFDNYNDMNNKEKELVQLSNCWPNDPMSYNLREGGNGQTGLSGEKNPMYGKNYQCYGLLQYNKLHKGETDVQRFGIEKAKELSYKKGIKHKGKPKTEEHKQKIAEAHKNINVLNSMSAEKIQQWKNKISKIHKGKPKTEEHKQKIAEAHKGKTHTEETKNKIRLKNIGKIQSKETKLKLSMALKGKIVSEETKKKMSLNNAMNNHSIMDFMTPEEISAWKYKISQSSKGRKRMIHPVTKHRIFCKKEECEKYLQLGYIFGCKI